MGGLIFVGLGLAGLGDVTMRGLEAMKSADVVVAEFYTSRLLGTDAAELEKLAGKPVRILKREDVEVGADVILRQAKTKTVAFLVVGDAMTATTHQDLRQRAEELGVSTRLVPGVSIMTAAPGAAGLQSYKFGRTTTIPFPEGKYMPESPYDVIRENKARGLHTLVLLDIQADRDRFMGVPEAVDILQQIEARRKEHVVEASTFLVGLARVGSADERIVYAKASDWKSIDLGAPLHCLIVPGSLHFQEETALQRWTVKASQSRSV